MGQHPDEKGAKAQRREPKSVSEKNLWLPFLRQNSELIEMVKQ
jgi:hypothetical protein